MNNRFRGWTGGQSHERESEWRTRLLEIGLDGDVNVRERDVANAVFFAVIAIQLAGHMLAAGK